MNFKYRWLSTAEASSLTCCEIGELCHLFLSLLGLGSLQEYSRQFWIDCLMPWTMFALSSESSSCDTETCLFILIFYLWAKEPLLCQVLTRFVFEVRVRISSTQEGVGRALKGGELCDSELLQRCGDYRMKTCKSWEVVSAAILLHGGWCLQPLLRSFVVFRIGDFWALGWK